MTLSKDEIVRRLEAAIEAAGSQKVYAQLHGMSEQYLSDVLRGRRDPGKRILDALGVERVVRYRDKPVG